MTRRSCPVFLLAIVAVHALCCSAYAQPFPLSSDNKAANDNAGFLRSASQRSVQIKPAGQARADSAAIAKMQAASHYLNLGAPQAVPGWMQLHDSYGNQAMTMRKLDVLFLGDSLVEGWRGTYLGKATKDDAGVSLAFKNLAQQFGPKTSIKAFGIAGDTTDNLQWRLLNGELPLTLDVKTAVISIGTNDLTSTPAKLPEQVTQKIDQIVDFLQTSHPSTNVIITALLPESVNVKGAVPSETYQTVNRMLHGVYGGTPDTSTQFVDCSASLLAADGSPKAHFFMQDALSLQLTSAGYQAWANCLSPYIQHALTNSRAPVSYQQTPVSLGSIPQSLMPQDPALMVPQENNKALPPPSLLTPLSDIPLPKPLLAPTPIPLYSLPNQITSRPIQSFPPFFPSVTLGAPPAAKKTAKLPTAHKQQNGALQAKKQAAGKAQSAKVVAGKAPAAAPAGAPKSEKKRSAAHAAAAPQDALAPKAAGSLGDGGQTPAPKSATATWLSSSLLMVVTLVLAGVLM